MNQTKIIITIVKNATYRPGYTNTKNIETIKPYTYTIHPTIFNKVIHNNKLYTAKLNSKHLAKKPILYNTQLFKHRIKKPKSTKIIINLKTKKIYIYIYKNKNNKNNFKNLHNIIQNILQKSGDIELNPGPMPNVLKEHPPAHRSRSKTYFIPNTIKFHPEYQHITQKILPLLNTNHTNHNTASITFPNLSSYINQNRHFPISYLH